MTTWQRMQNVWVALATCVVLWAFAAPDTAHAQARAGAERRVALVIGNDAYQSVPRLANAANDARAVGQALQRAGFATRTVVNGTRSQMNAAVNHFVEEVAGGGIGVFFFAGHGVQVANLNFLIPVDIGSIEREADIADQGVSLQGVQDKLADARARFTLLVIDACRDNPLPRRAGRSLGATRGLAQASSAEGQIVVFSAGANQQALDKLSASDPSPNGLFTREFLPWIEKPGVTIRDAVLGVRSAVRARARSVQHDQFPAIYDQAEGDFYFLPGRTGAATPAAAAPPAPSPPAVDPEQEAWTVSKAVNTTAAYDAYLREYPAGRFAGAARVAMAALRPAPVATGASPAATSSATVTPAAVDQTQTALQRPPQVAATLALAAAALKPATPAPTSAGSSAARRVAVSAPDIAENGAVVPVSFAFAPALRQGDMVSILLDDLEVARLRVDEGSLERFGTRLRLPANAAVSARCHACQSESKAVLVTLGGAPSPAAAAGSGALDPIRLRLQGNVLRVLAGVDAVNDGTALLSAPGVKATVTLSGFVSQNPFFQFDGSFAGGEACLTLTVGARSRRDCAAGTP